MYDNVTITTATLESRCNDWSLTQQDTQGPLSVIPASHPLLTTPTVHHNSNNKNNSDTSSQTPITLLPQPTASTDDETDSQASNTSPSSYTTSPANTDLPSPTKHTELTLSHLSLLPPELLNQTLLHIFHLAFNSGHLFPYQCPLAPSHLHRHKNQNPNLLTLNHAIYTHYHPLLYTQNTWVIAPPCPRTSSPLSPPPPPSPSAKSTSSSARATYPATNSGPLPSIPANLTSMKKPTTRRCRRRMRCCWIFGGRSSSQWWG